MSDTSTLASVGDKLEAMNANWSFKGATATHFDDHVSKSVPLYREGHRLVCDLSDYFIANGSRCYELGCSTGSLTLDLAVHNICKPNARFIGIDVEADMISIANGKKERGGVANAEFLQDDVLQFDFKSPDMIVAYYTVQFIRPAQRQALIDRIYRSLNWGGAFLLFEKVRANDARFQDIMTGLYNDYKLEQGYAGAEIFAKARSLKGVLEPFSTQGNVDMLKRAGFSDVMSVMKFVCFEGFLAIK